MSWAYTGDPAGSKKDQCRFIIGDTNANEPLLQDEEIQYMIAEANNNESLLLYNLFSHVAILYAKDIKKSLGPQSEDPTERIKFFQAKAEYYRKRLAMSGLSVPKYKYPKIFHKGMQSNPPWPGDDGNV